MSIPEPALPPGSQPTTDWAKLNFIVQLGFVGSSQYTLWALTVVAMNVLVLYALIVRWGDVREAAS